MKTVKIRLKLYADALLKTARNLYRQKDRLWLSFWLGAMLLAAVWNLLFLNKPALQKVVAGFVNTFFIAVLVIIFSFLLAWNAVLALHYLQKAKNRIGYLILNFLLNLIRSVPQIVGILLAYIGIQYLLQSQYIHSTATVFILMAFAMSIFIFLELSDLMQERIRYFQKLEFYQAMLVCGIPERRIINWDILWKNSRIHIFNKLVAILGMAVFLQCSVDFIISVGLSAQVSSVNLPVTLGSLLAKIDSKQDILAIGYVLTHPTYIVDLFFKHLQGVTVAFLIVFTILSSFKISNGIAERYRL